MSENHPKHKTVIQELEEATNENRDLRARLQIAEARNATPPPARPVVPAVPAPCTFSTTRLALEAYERIPSTDAAARSRFRQLHAGILGLTPGRC